LKLLTALHDLLMDQVRTRSSNRLSASDGSAISLTFVAAMVIAAILLAGYYPRLTRSCTA
jgi:hypothetical protein